jgi:hypothetical protein
VIWPGALGSVYFPFACAKCHAKSAKVYEFEVEGEKDRSPSKKDEDYRESYAFCYLKAIEDDFQSLVRNRFKTIIDFFGKGHRLIGRDDRAGNKKNEKSSKKAAN